MFLLLRQLRRELLQEKKLFKYCAYAAGEILLVVIGILIALAVNNRDINQQNAQLELQYYQIIWKQIQEDKALIEAEILALEARKSVYSEAFQIIRADSRDDSTGLGEKVIRLLEYGDFRRKSSVYQTLLSSGEIRHIKNNDVIDGLQEIERIYEITERLEDIQKDVVNSYHAPAILYSIDLSSSAILDHDAIFNLTFSNRFIITNTIIDEKISEFQKAIGVIEKTTKHLDLEINPNSLPTKLK